METSGQWLQKALVELSTKIKTGLDMDADFISGLVSYCEMAPPLDAKEFLDNVVGQDAGKDVIEAYLRLRGHYVSPSSQYAANSTLKAYVKQRDDPVIIGAKKQQKGPKENKRTTGSVNQEIHSEPGYSDKKISGKIVSASKVFQQGKACSCQGREHKLVSNCLSCGRLVCEQEGEGPCNFCGALVLKEEGEIIQTKADESEAYAKRLVDSERNSAARIDDGQSDCCEIEMESTPITPNPALKIHPVFVETPKQKRKRVGKAGVCLDITGRVQHDRKVCST